MIEYTLTRSKRKTLGLYIRNGAMEVRAPLGASKRDIDSFITSKSEWIQGKLKHSKEQAQNRESFRLNYGDSILYLGKEYPIVSKEGKQVGFSGEYFYMPPNLTAKQIKSACIQIYRMLAKHDLADRVLDFSQQMSVTPSAIKINSARTRWGSCSSKKCLNFSWRLIMADRDVIDYVVVHELAHLTEMNHSKRFWAIVEAIIPNYKQRKEGLNKISQRLAKEDWES